MKQSKEHFDVEQSDDIPSKHLPVQSQQKH